MRAAPQLAPRRASQQVSDRVCPRVLRGTRRVAYRVQQFFAALFAAWLPMRSADLAAARRRLPAAAWPLFLGMARTDRQHSLRVLRLIEERGECPAPLAQAALLHDCAKGPSGVRLWHRVAAVLMKHFWPASYTAWRGRPAPEGTGWRYGLWAHLHHPELSAEMAAAMGCSPEAVELIRHHQERLVAVNGGPQMAEWLAVLQAVDDDN